MAKTLEERFWEKVDVRGPDDCWLWVGSKTSQGYGRILVHGKIKAAHRVSWELAHGEIPEGMCVCHHCDNPGCVNPGPGHLFLATQIENIADRDRKGRMARCVGSANPHSKLAEAQVIEIRARHAAGEAQVALAKEFGVYPSTIRQIVYRKTWKHVAGGREKDGGRLVGSACPWAKLTEDQVIEIRERCAAGETQAALAKEFGVTQSTVGYIVHRVTWKHV